MSTIDRPRRWLYVVAALVGGGLLGIVIFSLWTWRGIERVVIVRPDAVDLAAPESDPGADDTAIPQFRLPPVPSATDGVDTFLLVGSDDRSNLEDLDGFGDFAGARADVLLLLIRPRDQGKPAIVSLPRDLWVSTPCGQERINQALEGCEGMNGESTLLVTVESLTGLGVDHLGLVDLAGFQEVVDDLGGYEICLDNPVRDQKAALDLPAGCRMADGADTLSWLRSRTTEELTDEGNWVVMSGVSDLTRNERQRQFLVEMLSRLSDFTDPQDALSVAQTIAPHVTVDSDLGITEAVSLAWTMRGVGRSIEEIEIPVADYTTQAGANVLVATADIARMIAEVVAVETVGQSEAIINAG